MEKIRFVLFALRPNLPLHTGSSALKRSDGYAPATDGPIYLGASRCVALKNGRALSRGSVIADMNRFGWSTESFVQYAG